MTVKVSRPSIDIRGTLDELNKPSGIAGNAMLAAETPQEQFNLIGAGRRNLIINGGFDVWQRGASFTSVGSGYSADRFFQSVYGGATPNITKVAGFGDFRNAIRYTGVNGGASEQLELEHRIEGGNLPQTGMLTLSYWVRGSKAGSFKAGRLINGTTGVTNTGRADVEVSTDWSRVTVTVSALAATDAQYYRLFWADSLLSYMSDDSVWLEFTGVQLEIGSVATPFEHRLYGEELALCQRYYERINGTSPWFFGHGYNSQVYMTVEWKVPKRVSGGTVYYSDQGAPASMFTLYGNTGSSGAIDGVITSVSLSNAAVTALSFYLSLSSSANTPYGTSVMWRLDSARWIAYDAEI